MINEKIDKLISELDTASGMLIVASIKDKTVRQAKEKVSKVSFELGNLIEEIETEKAIDGCRVRQMEMSDDRIGDCGTDENGKCIGYASGEKPCDECKECVYGCAFEEEE